MNLWKLMVPRFSRRLASKQGRFTLAVSLGFIVTATGVLTVALDARSGNAEGFLNGLFGQGSLFGQQSSAAMAGFGETTARRPVARRHAVERVHSVHYVARVPHRHAHDEPSEGSDAAHFAHAPHAGNGPHVAFSSAAQSMCVRTCDGFAFPVGTYHGAGDLAAHEATCHAECPGAATSLFVLPPSSASIDAAVSVRTGEPYSKLPDAFHYTTLISDACTCHAATGGTMKSLLRDFTLRRGDAVMTAQGFRVFHGGAHYPFRRQDFVALNHSRDVTQDARLTFKAIERASLASYVPLVLSKVPAADAANTPTSGGTRQLEHQASR